MVQVLKKNILSVICGVVVVLAIVAYFVFVTGLYTGSDGLEAKAKERKSNFDTLQGLVTKQRTLPVVELNSSPTARPLEVFPTTEVIKVGEGITKQLKDQSSQIVEIARQYNQRPTLMPNFFPNPTDPQKYRFRDAYKIHMNKELPAVLQAVAPPTEADVQEAREKLWRDKYADQIITVNGREANREQIDRQYTEEIAGLLERLERETALTHRMYIETEAINKNTLVLSDETPPTDQMWYAQTATWIQDDLVAAIAGFNDRELQRFKPNERNLINAPVKHLINLQVPQGVDQYIAKAQTGAEGETGPGVPDYTLSPTGRNSNALYDVVKFTMVVKMDARFVARYIQELGRGKFLTVHKVNLTAVDNAVAKNDGFVYGNAPIVQVQLAGEALLMRSWTKSLVPDKVKPNLPEFDKSSGEGDKPADAKPAEGQTAAAQ
jgi:hypothetical protein